MSSVIIQMPFLACTGKNMYLEVFRVADNGSVMTFLGPLIMNSLSGFHNLKWRIEDDGGKSEKSTIILVQICTRGFRGS